MDSAFANGSLNAIARASRLFNGFAELKIEKSSDETATTLRLIGNFQSGDLVELKNQFQSVCGAPKIVLDLKEVTLVDLEVVRFFASCKVNGVILLNCAQYIRNWIRREQT